MPDKQNSGKQNPDTSQTYQDFGQDVIEFYQRKHPNGGKANLTLDINEMHVQLHVRDERHLREELKSLGLLRNN